MHRVILTSAEKNHVFFDSIGIDKNKNYKCTMVSSKIQDKNDSVSGKEYAVSIYNNMGYLHDINSSYTSSSVTNGITFELRSSLYKDSSIMVNTSFFNDVSMNVNILERVGENVHYSNVDKNNYNIYIELVFTEV
jgi:hypothetical protein